MVNWDGQIVGGIESRRINVESQRPIVLRAEIALKKKKVSSFILSMRYLYCWRTLRPRPELVAARAAPAKASKDSGFMGNKFRIG
jgi:hypothetical protein